VTGTIGSGKLYFGSEFVGANASAAVLDADVQAFGVGTETYAATVNESGGILALGTGGSNADNALIRSGPFAPRDGKMVVRARFKYPVFTTIAVWFGWAETLDTTTPVMPMEFSGTAMTYNPGGMIGIGIDTDGNTDDWRAGMGDGSAAISDSSTGIRANATTTADRWFESEVILNEDGSGEVWLGDSSDVQTIITRPNLKLVKRFDAGTLLTPTDLFFAALMIEVRTGSARTLEIDYFYGEAGRDWRY
jgi:hypothetical protein